VSKRLFGDRVPIAEVGGLSGEDVVRERDQVSRLPVELLEVGRRHVIEAVVRIVLLADQLAQCQGGLATARLDLTQQAFCIVVIVTA
jgi:hypothetical protein